MRNATDWNLLARYLAGECTAEEERAVRAWLRADPVRRERLQTIRRIWADSQQPPRPPHDEAEKAEADWARVKAAIRNAERVRSETRAQRPARAPYAARKRARPSLMMRRGTAAAVALALLLAGGLWVAKYGGFSSGGSASETLAWREIVTERGERAKLQLADGTQVTLNVDSRLRLPQAFAPDVRQVQLQGEAFFDVAPDPDRPFVVQAEGATVEVRGTAFGVRSYPEDRRVEVAVAEGAVALRADAPDAPPAELKAGQWGALNAADAAVVTRTVTVGAYLGWTEGRLVFDNAALPDVAARLARWYDLHFELQDASLRSLHLTATLNSTSVRDVMDVIAATLGIAYRIEGSRVILMASPTAPPPAAPGGAA